MELNTGNIIWILFILVIIIPSGVTFREGVNRIVLLSLYPHYSCHQTGVMLNSAVKAANGDVASVDRIIAKLKGNKSDYMTSSCSISAVYRWNTHPALTSVWF